MARGEVRDDQLSWVSSGSVGVGWVYHKIPFSANAQIVQNTGSGNLEVAWGYSAANPVPTDVSTFPGVIILAGDAKPRTYYGRYVTNFGVRGQSATSYILEGWVTDSRTVDTTSTGTGETHTTLGDLMDVSTTGAASGNALTFNGAIWVPGVGGSSGSYVPLNGSVAMTGALKPYVYSGLPGSPLQGDLFFSKTATGDPGKYVYYSSSPTPGWFTSASEEWVLGQNFGLTTAENTWSQNQNFSSGVTVSGSSLDPASIPTITSGAGVPGTTPVKIGDAYIDTQNGVYYGAVCTTGSGCWKKLSP